MFFFKGLNVRLFFSVFLFSFCKDFKAMLRGKSKNSKSSEFVCVSDKENYTSETVALNINIDGDDKNVNKNNKVGVFRLLYDWTLGFFIDRTFGRFFRYLKARFNEILSWNWKENYLNKEKGVGVEIDKKASKRKK